MSWADAGSGGLLARQEAEKSANLGSPDPTPRQKGVNTTLAEVRVSEGESIESALKRFKKKIQKAGILSEIKRRERYEKPSVRKKRKSEAARKRRS